LPPNVYLPPVSHLRTMAVDPWKSPALELPTDGDIVWVRILNYYGEPFQAKYTDADQTFTSQVSPLIFPAYYVARWKAL